MIPLTPLNDEARNNEARNDEDRNDEDRNDETSFFFRLALRGRRSFKKEFARDLSMHGHLPIQVCEPS